MKMNTMLLDKNGVAIKIGDRIRIPYCGGCLWDGTVTFEDGVVTVSILDAEQFKNPDKWNQPHDWVKSRSWACVVGYGEYGSWNCPRRPIVSMAENWKSYDDVRPLYEKYGYAKRIINVEVLNVKTEPQGEGK